MGIGVGATVAVHVCPLCAFETSHPAVHTYPTAQSHRQGGVRLASSTHTPPVPLSQPCEPSRHWFTVGATVEGAAVGKAVSGHLLHILGHAAARSGMVSQRWAEDARPVPATVECDGSVQMHADTSVRYLYRKP